MSDQKKEQLPSKPANLNEDEDFDEMNRAGKRGIFGRFNQRFNDALQTGRAPEQRREPMAEIPKQPEVTADDVAIRRARNVSSVKMVIPEGVIIEGSLTGGPDTEISGRIEGNVSVEGRLYLGQTALISGSVRAGSCHIEGLVEGKVECSDEIELGKTGRLNADVLAGKRITVAGQVYGNITTPGLLRLLPACTVIGDIRTRRLAVEEGATLNGRCSMRPPAQQQGAAPPPAQK